MIDHDEPPAGGYIALKTVAVATPIPTYGGNDDLNIHEMATGIPKLLGRTSTSGQKI